MKNISYKKSSNIKKLAFVAGCIGLVVAVALTDIDTMEAEQSNAPTALPAPKKGGKGLMFANVAQQAD